MFDEVEEIGFDNNSNIVKQSETLPTEIQQSINSIVNDSQSDEVKNDTKEMLKGGVLGGVMGAIICLYRRKNVWLGVLAGGLIGGYLAKENIIKLKK
tara:strand:+ start:7358 stop:7648 length:291 start_codon:yes stop_codon:yes gene_type:complete